MAALTKDQPVQISTPAPPFNADISELRAGENIAMGDACTLRSDGKIWRASGAAADANARIFGWASDDVKAGYPITIWDNVNFYYSTAMTPGTRFYLSGTVPGGLDTAASTGGTVPVAVAIDATRVRVFASWMRQ